MNGFHKGENIFKVECGRNGVGERNLQRLINTYLNIFSNKISISYQGEDILPVGMLIAGGGGFRWLIPLPSLLPQPPSSSHLFDPPSPSPYPPLVQCLLWTTSENFCATFVGMSYYQNPKLRELLPVCINIYCLHLTLNFHVRFYIPWKRYRGKYRRR